MERCPICRARYKDEPLCSRCGSDLSMLLKIESEAEMLQLQAIALLKKNDFSAARQLAKQALGLKYTPLAAVLSSFPPHDLTLEGDENDDVEQYYLVQERDL